MSENKKSVSTTVIAMFIFVLAVFGILAVTYLFVAGLTYLLCLGFGMEWSWLYALGVWAVCIMLRWVLSAARNGSNK